MKNKEMMSNIIDVITGLSKKNNESLLDSVSEETKTFYRKIFESGNPLENYDLFYSYPLSDLDESLLISFLKNEKTVFLFQRYDFLSHHLEKLFSRFEGFACSADKQRTVLKRLYDYLESGTPIEFDYSAEYTFHYPNKILRVESEILEFYDVMIGLFYGNFDPYLLFLKSLSEKYGKSKSWFKNHIEENLGMV